jgi:hypothetical protein
MELDSKSLFKKHYGTSKEFSKYWISNETDTDSEGYDKGIMDVSSSKYDKRNTCKSMCYDKKSAGKSRKVPFVTQTNDWIIKCGTGIKRRSVMHDKVIICDRNRIWCFGDSSLLLLERGNEIMLWGSRILYDLCYAIMWVSKICM